MPFIKFIKSNAQLKSYKFIYPLEIYEITF